MEIKSPEELFNEYSHIAKETIFRMYPHPKGICKQMNIEFDDLLQYANTALWKACLTYDTTKGTKFMTHAINNIRWHVTERLNRETSIIKYNSNRKYDESEKFRIISMDAKFSDSFDDLSSLHELVSSDINVELDVMDLLEEDKILSILDDTQKEILTLQEKGITYKQIGEMWNMTGANVKAKIYKARKQLEKHRNVG